MNVQPTPPRRPGLPVWVWVLLALGAACFVCGGGAVAVMALGAMSDDGATASSGSSGSSGRPAPAAPYRLATIAQRGATLDQPLTGRWLYMTGGDLSRVLSEGTYSRIVEVTSTGHLHELVFEEDGTYRWAFLYASNYLIKTKAWASERGTWQLQGTTLVLTPETWQAEYTVKNTQHKEDEDLSPRQYQVVGAVFETLTVGNQAAERFPGIVISGAAAPWDIESSNGVANLDLQRQ